MTEQPQPEQPQPNRGGRPSLYNEEVAAEICRRIAGGASVAEVGRAADMPSDSTIWDWLADPRKPEFRAAYIEASAYRGEVLVEKAVTVAEDTLERSKGVEIEGDEAAGVRPRRVSIDKSEVAAARLVCDTLMRRAAQLNPKKYGNLTRLAGEDGGPISVEIVRFGAAKSGEEG